MSHLKRLNTDKRWAIEKKEKVYVVSTIGRSKNCIPLGVLLRDILKVARTLREAKLILKEGKVSVNNKKRYEVKYPVFVFDEIEVSGKNYNLAVKNSRFVLEEGKTDRMLKVLGKKQLDNKKIQLNLSNGFNILSNEKINTGDSVIVDGKKIIKILPMKEGANAVIISGKNISEEGKKYRRVRNSLFLEK